MREESPERRSYTRGDADVVDTRGVRCGPSYNKVIVIRVARSRETVPPQGAAYQAGDFYKPRDPGGLVILQRALQVAYGCDG